MLGLFTFLVGHTAQNISFDHQAGIKIIESHSIFSSSIIYAIITGTLLWLSSFLAGLLDNWLSYRKFHQALSKTPGIKKIHFILDRYNINTRKDRSFVQIANNVILAIMLVFTPFLAQSLKLSYEPRHVTISAGLTWMAFVGQSFNDKSKEIIEAAIGIFFIGFFNVVTSYFIAFKIAMMISHISPHQKKMFYKGALLAIIKKPHLFFFPTFRSKKDRINQER